MASFSHAVSVVLVPLMIASPVWSQTAPIPATPVESGAPGQLQLKLIDSDGAQVLSNTRTARGLGVQVVDGNGTPVGDAAVVFRFPEAGSSASFADGSHSAVAYTDGAGNAHVGNFQWNALPGSVSVRVTASKGTTHAGLLIEETLTGGVPSQASVPARPIPVATTEREAAIPDEQPEETVMPSAAAKIAGAVNAAGADYLSNPYHGARLGVSPMVSISSTNSNNGHDFAYHGSSKKKWLILAIVAGAGAGAALALMNGKSSSAGTSASGVSVGTPTISIGHP